MHIRLTPKKLHGLHPTDILFQTGYWGQVKNILGWESLAFDIEPWPKGHDVLALVTSIGANRAAAYVPHGPEFAPEEEHYGLFLEALSEGMARYLGSRVIFIRYDLPWKSPYADEMVKKQWQAYPEPRIREMRMNFGTRHCNLRKAPTDMIATHSLIVPLTGSPEDILGRMRPKTRYNIRLAERKGVCVRLASRNELPVFYELHLETARRNRFQPCQWKHLLALFDACGREHQETETVLLLATHRNDVLAGAVLALSHNGAVFLHGASSRIKRDHMGPYALHWGAMSYARSWNCRTYDMGAVSPGDDPEHPFYGLFRFKKGFGGTIQHRSGTWDFPLDEGAYTAFRNSEILPCNP